jgi:hypothetical protein
MTLKKQYSRKTMPYREVEKKWRDGLFLIVTIILFRLKTGSNLGILSAVMRKAAAKYSAVAILVSMKKKLNGIICYSVGYGKLAEEMAWRGSQPALAKQSLAKTRRSVWRKP